MRKYLAVVMCLPVLALAAVAQAGMVQNGDSYVFDDGANHVEFQKVTDMQGEYRIFGINPNTYKNTPIGYIDAFVPMISLARDREIFKQSGPQQCEMLAAQEQKTVSVIFANDTVREKFQSYQNKPREETHFALSLSGVILRKTKDLYKGESTDGMTASGPISIDSVLLVNSADIAPW